MPIPPIGMQGKNKNHPLKHPASLIKVKGFKITRNGALLAAFPETSKNGKWAKWLPETPPYNWRTGTIITRLSPSHGVRHWRGGLPKGRGKGESMIEGTEGRR